MLGSRFERNLAGCLSVASALSCASDFSTGHGGSGGTAGMSLGGHGSGSGGAPEAGQGGSGSDAGETNTGGSAGSMGGTGGDAGESSEGGAVGSQGGSGQAGGRSGSGGRSSSGRSSGGRSSGGVPSIGGATGQGGAANTGGLGIGGMGNHEPVSNDALVYWFSADFGVNEVDGAVAKWLDHSGNERDAGQILAESRPTLGKFGASDLPAVIFDGDGDYLGMPPLTEGFDAGLTFFAVARVTAGNGCMAMLEVSNGAEVDDVSFLWDIESLTYEVVSNTLRGQEGAFAVGEPRLLEVTHSPEEQVSLFLNGLATGAGTFAAPLALTRNQTFLGRTLYSDCHTWSGELAEVLLYSRVLPTDERQAIELYLNEKWGCCGS